MNQLVTMQLDIVRYPRYHFMGPNMTGCSIVTHLEPVLSTRRFQVKYFFVLGSTVISSIYMLHHCWKEYSLIPRPSVRPPVTQLCVPYRGSENETMERGFSIINFC